MLIDVLNTTVLVLVDMNLVALFLILISVLIGTRKGKKDEVS